MDVTTDGAAICTTYFGGLCPVGDEVKNTDGTEYNSALINTLDNRWNALFSDLSWKLGEADGLVSLGEALTWQGESQHGSMFKLPPDALLGVTGCPTSSSEWEGVASIAENVASLVDGDVDFESQTKNMSPWHRFKYKTGLQASKAWAQSWPLHIDDDFEEDGFSEEEAEGSVTDTLSAGLLPGQKRRGKSARRKLAARDQFWKTRWCRFALEGHCKKGDVCEFAHSARELNPLPKPVKLGVAELGPPSPPPPVEERPTRSRHCMCPGFMAGRCTLGSKCTYFHSRSELRAAVATSRKTRLPPDPLASLPEFLREPVTVDTTLDTQQTFLGLPAGFPALALASSSTEAWHPLEAEPSILPLPHPVEIGEAASVDSQSSSIPPVPSSAQGKTKQRVRGQFYKTQMCKFYMQQTCKLGDECRFAHGDSELTPVPDLTKTSICQLFRQGLCTEGKGCRFAHGLYELRSTPAFRGHPLSEEES